MDCELVAFTLWNLQLFLGGFLLLRHSCTNVLGPKFRISSTIYFHCRKSIMYIVLQALQLIDHVCIIYAKNLSHWPGRTVRKLITSFYGCVILQLMLALMVYFHFWAAYFKLHISFNEFYLKAMFQFDSFEGPEVKFHHVLVHKAMMLRCYHMTSVCGMPDQSICERFEWVLFQICTYLLIFSFFVIWNRNTCQE